MNTLVFPILNFSYFKSEDCINKLIELFVSQGEGFDPYGPIDYNQEVIQFKLSSFIEKRNDKNESYEEEIVEDVIFLNFKDDFLYPSINNISINYDKWLQNKSSKIYGIEQKRDFYEMQKDYLLQEIEFIQESEHFIKIVDRLSDAANRCIEIVEIRIDELNKKENYYKPIRKIPLKLTKSQVLLLFHRMHTAGIIDPKITSTRLFSLVGLNFTYSGDKTISKAYDSLQEYTSERKKSRSALDSLDEKFERIFE